MIGEKQKLSLYVHTHWDREWYWAFERYRTVLVSAIKLVVQAVESGELPNFHFDGQVCALEDFLELEPTFEDRIKELNSQNRLSIGPWYVLADQMLVGGESLIRNMEFGLTRSRRFGQPMMVGYSPDTFGHSQDLPRILKGFGIKNAIVWRGVPELDQGPEFFWKSPDGSEVLAIALTKGYYQTMFHDGEGAVEEDKIDAIVENLLPWLSLKFDKDRGAIVENEVQSPVYSRNTHGCLVPVGGDHLKPPMNFAQIVKLVEKRLADLLKKGELPAGMKLSSIKLDPIQLPDYLKMVARAVQEVGTPVRTIEGELRENSSARQHAAGYMLPGVLSTRLYLKRENRILEHRLSRVCEPLYALMSFGGISQYPALELDNAWKYMLKNHPHDSMCGCSVDDVHREMMTRFASIHHILDVLDQRVKQDLLVPGVHEWSHEESRKSRAGNKPAIENAGFGRGTGNLADPDVPLTSMAVFNFSTEHSSAPVKVSLAIPTSYLEDNSPKGESGSKSSSLRSAMSAAGVLSDAHRCQSEKQLREAGTRYLKDVLGDETDFQIDSVRFETELFGELGGVPLYKDVNYLEGWMWASDIAPLGVTKLDLQQGKSQHAGSQGTVRNAARTLASSAVAAGAKPGSQSSSAKQAHPKGEVSHSSQTGDSGKSSANDEQSPTVATVSASNSGLSNGFFDLHVASDGQLSIDVSGSNGKKETFQLRHKFQDVADAGDSYNFDPILHDVPITARFKSCAVNQIGPLVGSLKLVYNIDLPVSLVENADEKHWGDMEGGKDLVSFERSKKTIEHEITTIVTLKRGVPLVFFETTWDNKVPDHRLEVVFDTGAPVKKTWSENHFSLVERNVSAHVVELPVGKYTEAPLDRFPCQRFFVANGQAFYNFGLPEYGVDGNNVSITTLRAISMLSRKRLLTRGGGAGPYMPVPEGNCIGENKVSYGWAPLAVSESGQAKTASTFTDSQRALAYRLAESFEGNLWVTPLTPESEDALESGSVINVGNEKIRCVTLYSNDGGESILLRLLNVALSPEVAEMTVQAERVAVEQVDLDGNLLNVIPEKNGTYKLTCGVNELITLKISGKT